jgi:hypothetical protein
VLLAQGYDDTGAASRTSIIIGILAFPSLVIIAIVWQKLKDAKENEKHIEHLQNKVSELERAKTSKPNVNVPPTLQNKKPQSASGLTKEQQVCIDEVFARAGKPSAALQREIDEIRAVKTEDELTKLFLRDSNVVRPAIEAELLSMVLLAKKAELKAIKSN